MCEDSKANKLKEIIDKYAKEEEEIERRLQECDKLRAELRSQYNAKSEDISISSLEEIQGPRKKAQARNEKIIQDLQRAKGILRSQLAYSPTEDELRDAAAVYRSYLHAPDGKTRKKIEKGDGDKA